MQETRYMISDASKIIDVKPHVLRYWQDELELDIPRNEMGHRHYRQEDIDLLKSIKTLREKGFELKAIKYLIPEMQKVKELDSEHLYGLRDKLNIALGLVDDKNTEGEEMNKKKEKKMDEEVSFSISLKNDSEPNVMVETKEHKASKDSLNEIGKEPEQPFIPFEEDMSESQIILENEEEINLAECDGRNTDKESIEKKESREGRECNKNREGRECNKNREGRENNKNIEGREDNENRGGREKRQGIDSMEEQEGMPNEAGNGSDLMVKTVSAEAAITRMQNALSDSRIEEDKLMKFRQVMSGIMVDAMKENNERMTAKMTDAITETMVKELDYHMRVREEREEERFKQLDRTIRDFQQQRQQVAASKEGKDKKKESKFFKKNKKRV